MVFSSVIFLFLFLPIVLLVYFLLKVEYRNCFLLLSSLFFYAWGEPINILVMLGSISINYTIGLVIGYGQSKEEHIYEKLGLLIGICLNLGMLFYYKYFDFSIITLNHIFSLDIPLKKIVLPIGISFFTFQGMSYILDLYFEKVKVQKKFINIALYITMFPQLIAGPIVRYIDVNNQIDSRECTLDYFSEGVHRFVKGISKKVLIANNVALIADQIFSNGADGNSILTAWLGIICYTLQIYYDFSGYSDMAIGLGKMFGFDFLENFNFPYIATSITEFWRRWHISLSTWFRDYLYIPLGGNRKGNVYINLFIVFLATGLWHGAAWNFVFWGLWHGIFLIIEKKFMKNKMNKIHKSLRWFYTISVVIIGWVFFRSPDLIFAIKYLSIMFGISTSVNPGYTVFWYLTPKTGFIVMIGIVLSIPYTKLLNRFEKKEENILNNEYIRTCLTSILLFLSVMFIMTSNYNPFIYFRF